jgi:hypothetical protein
VLIASLAPSSGIGPGLAVADQFPIADLEPVLSGTRIARATQALKLWRTDFFVSLPFDPSHITYCATVAVVVLVSRAQANLISKLISMLRTSGILDACQIIVIIYFIVIV